MSNTERKAHNIVIERMKRTGAGELRREDIGRKVKLQGWVQRRRDLGGVLFLELRDRSGLGQVVVKPEECREALAVLEPVRSEWVVEVVGTVIARAGEVNPRMATGEVEVLAESAQVLSKCDPLPFPVDARTDALEDTRLKYRFLDLRRPELQRNLMLRHRLTWEVRRYFHEQGFLDIETPILTKSTPGMRTEDMLPVRRGNGFHGVPFHGGVGRGNV